MEHPKVTGDRTTLAIMTALHAAGFGVLLPFGEHSRYDLAIDDGQRLARVQCKTGRLRDGAVRFKACSSYAHHRSATVRSRPYGGAVEFFAIYCPETGRVYLVPISDLEIRHQGALRVTPPRNGQQRGVRQARGYEIGGVEIQMPRSDQARRS